MSQVHFEAMWLLHIFQDGHRFRGIFIGLSFFFFSLLQTFWWLIEGKFGNREESLASRLLDLVSDAAARCTDEEVEVYPCFNSEWEMETPGTSLKVGITAVSFRGS